MMPSDYFDLPEDLADSVDVVYVEDEELDNLEETEVVEAGEDIDPLEDKSTVTFKSHGSSVFCISLNNTNTLAATGGEDDLAYIWDVSTGKIELECTGHNDSVTSASFSHDGKYVVTGDMSGLIQVWEVGEKKLIWCYEGDEIEWLIWHPATHVLLAGVQSGEIYMWQIPQGNCKLFATGGSKCVAGCLLPSGSQLAAGYENGAVKIWDLKSGSVAQQFSGSSLTGLKMSADGKLVVTCGSTGGTFVLKTVDCKIAASLQAQTGEEIEAAAFCPEADLPVVATGSLNGDVCFWDIARQTLRHKTSIGYSITTMLWGRNAMLFVASVDGVVYVYNGRNGQLITTITGHTSAVLDMHLSIDGKLLLTASDDATAKVFHIQKCCADTSSTS